ncbi:MAG TPA: LytTR family DNA-binding domain-containing protein [Casimicrobiaceae bacterium]|nr:LytTR family DNA-binding domain-containing protein [Casimicrobiaceae bacterium]
MPTALIADDEPLLREQLKRRLSETWPELAIAIEAGNGAEALALFDAAPTDIAFLDIHMPGLSGLETARSIGGRAHVVFVTAYDDHAVEAFEEGAIDYLLKPVTSERLTKVVARLKSRLSSTPHDIEALIQRLNHRGGDPYLRWIRASLGASMRMLAVEDVLFFQAEDKYTKVVTADGEALIKKPIKELYEELDPEAFWQIHRSTIVSLRAIANVERDWRDQPVITLKSRPEKLTVSRTFAHRFKAM